MLLRFRRASHNGCFRTFGLRIYVQKSCRLETTVLCLAIRTRAYDDLIFHLSSIAFALHCPSSLGGISYLLGLARCRKMSAVNLPASNQSKPLRRINGAARSRLERLWRSFDTLYSSRLLDCSLVVQGGISRHVGNRSLLLKTRSTCLARMVRCQLRVGCGCVSRSRHVCAAPMPDQPAHSFRINVDLSQEWILFLERRYRTSASVGVRANCPSYARSWCFSDLSSVLTASVLSRVGVRF
jgi:hypothetical protein